MLQWGEVVIMIMIATTVMIIRDTTPNIPGTTRNILNTRVLTPLVLKSSMSLSTS